MRHAFVMMSMESRRVPVHAMILRTKEKKIRRNGKKTKKTGMKVRASSYQHVVLLYLPLLSETIKVFDGNCSLRRRIFRAITVPRTCTLEQLLTTALRAFHIAREPTVSIQRCAKVRLCFIATANTFRAFKKFQFCNFSKKSQNTNWLSFFQQFYLTDLYATNGDEIQIQDPTPVLNLHKIEGKRPAIFLRFR